MDAAQALADLTEISAQIEAAVLAGTDGSVVASTFQQEGRGQELARAAVGLVFYDLKTCLRMLEREAEKPEKSAKADKAEKPTATTEKVGKASTPRKQPTTKKKEEEGGDESS